MPFKASGMGGELCFSKNSAIFGMRAGEGVMFVTEPDQASLDPTESIVGANAVLDDAAAFHLVVGAGGVEMCIAEETVALSTALFPQRYTECTCVMFTGDPVDWWVIVTVTEAV